ncbi:pimelyl-ACP methyl ester esterase BioV [Helicobacter cholecystus]|uniref:pimelyl-ACP methyl ester esterase BioV n=1 Tax=Helicobacter cholecystus TaxID=45498 RepID=UPI002738F3C0|nr:pimelyl-ACP methyl ester esterase BioV [Helicobacter cholecystus]
MHYFSGFCFTNERELFSHLPLTQDLFTLTGFSYGAIRAFKMALLSIQKGKRIQTLNLLSPAFFQAQSTAFIKMQLLGFRKNPQNYMKNFLSLCGHCEEKYFKAGTLEQLEELLYFKWQEEELEQLLNCGVKINVFLGGEDKIIPSLKAKDFFLPYATIYFYKTFNHCLNCDHL